VRTIGPRPTLLVRPDAVHKSSYRETIALDVREVRWRRPERAFLPLRSDLAGELHYVLAFDSPMGTQRGESTNYDLRHRR
jgi:hypothetical protein